jgi:hypothetical protein
LFHRQQAGVNVFIFNVLLFLILHFQKRIDLKVRFHIYLVTGSLLSAAMVAVYGAGAALFANILSLVLLSGAVAFPAMVVPMNVAFSSASAIISGPFNWIKELFSVSDSVSGKGRFLRKAGLIIMPLVVFIIFILLYSASSPYFNKLTGGVLKSFTQLMEKLSLWISPDVFMLGIAALLMYFAFIFGSYNRTLNIFNEAQGENLHRVRKIFSGRITALKTELNSGILLLAFLNLALAVMNVLDIYHVWLFFEWDGGYLKQFVHEGTWLLIISVLISMAIVIWYFRGNLNFYSGNRLLVKLSVFWLLQNALLVVSVAIRNIWYIHYFNLAFKRIWVFAFLILVLIGIITVFIKLRNRKSVQYLLVRNSLFAYGIVVFIGFFNWDLIIARYNVKHTDSAFFHTDFMMNLNSSTLPVLMLDPNTLHQIDTIRNNFYPNRHYYVPAQQFDERINERTDDYLAGYPKLNWQGKNITDALTYKRLSETRNK